jgi:hypothetical protein
MCRNQSDLVNPTHLGSRCIFSSSGRIDDQVKGRDVDSRQSAYISAAFHNERIVFTTVVWLAYEASQS